MTDIEELRARYRRLLRAYPGWYRRERGDELLTTLLDDAAEGQRRPGRADALDLLLGGLRVRLRPPRATTARVLTVVCALYAALAGAALAVFAGPYPGPPSAQQALVVATTVLGRAPQGVPGLAVECDLVCPAAESGDEVVMFDQPEDRTDAAVVVWADPTGLDPAQMRARLVAAGWTAGPVVGETSGLRWFDATRGELSASVSVRPPAAPEGAVTREGVLVVSHRATVAVVASVLAAALAAGAAGWLVAVWALQRWRRHTRSVRFGSALAGAPFVLVATATVVDAAMWLLVPVLTNTAINAVAVPLGLLTMVPMATVTAAGSAALCLALVALPGRGSSPVLGRRLV
ncbi:hypothetical protein AB0B31_26275 [Catellatospora citrea]|uniref:hypothetical protein n=1 Tax=Catellatospora citrea TaxID=53366 RepID=UPI0033F447C3